MTNGFTHYPQKQEQYRFFKGDLELPPHILILDGSGHLTFDVLSWLSEQQVSLSRMTWDGQVSTVLAQPGFSANPHRVEWQRQTRADPSKRMRFCVDLIQRKIDSAIRTLEKLAPRGDAKEKALSASYDALTTLELRPPRTVGELRTIEANAAAAYFRAWRGVPIKWRGRTRNPIPDAWLTIGARTSGQHLAGNRDATHPFNAMLNYAYAVLETKIRHQLIIQGYDPTIGIMHERGDGASAFIFDAMEPERAEIDRRLIAFVHRATFHADDFVLHANGLVRLNPKLASAVTTAVSSHSANML